MKTIVTTLNAKYIHTNLALRYLKTAAEPTFPVDMMEFTIKDPTLSIVSTLYKEKPDVIGFSCYIWNIEETIKVIQVLKTVAPETTIILGGPEVSYDSNEWLRKVPEIDYILMGEGETAFVEFLRFQNGEIERKDVPNICYIEDAKFYVHAQAPKIDLRELPSPFRFEEDIPHLKNRVIYVETSRGCPFSCQFCLSSIEVGVRYFNREKIKEDIRFLMANGARTIKFVDRTFNISRSYAMEMFSFLIDEHVPGVVFQFEITGDIMRPEVIEFLNERAPKGLFRFEIGVQSTNDATNELVKRRQNFEKLTRTVKMVKDGGKIDQHLDLIAGLPEEDYASFRQTFNDVFALRPEELQLGFLKLLRGTGLRIDAKKYGYVYVDQAPYEIFSNNVLSFDDVLAIKNAEDVLEKYWNAHHLDRTVEYLVTNVFETPFDFFQTFGTFWEQNGWSRIGHQFADLFSRLDAFLQTLQLVDYDKIVSLMKQDYFLHHTIPPRKIWWPHEWTKEESQSINRALLENSSILQSIFGTTEVNERVFHKQIMVTKVENGYMVAHFAGQQTPTLHVINEKDLLVES